MVEEAQLTVENLSVVYGERRLLQPLSFSIKRGEWLSIIGPNGAGKSTLLKALAGIVPCSASVLSIQKTPVLPLSQRQRASYLSYIPQQFDALVPFTVQEFLSLALYAENSPAGQERVTQAQELFRLAIFAGRSIQELSVGEMQRVLLAAAFVQGSDILLLDEPSSALDPFEESEMIKALLYLKKEKQLTILFVSHNLSAALSLADAVLVLTKGKKAYFGNACDLVATPVLEETFSQTFNTRIEGKRITLQSLYPIE